MLGDNNILLSVVDKHEIGLGYFSCLKNSMMRAATDTEKYIQLNQNKWHGY